MQARARSIGKVFGQQDTINWKPAKLAKRFTTSSLQLYSVDVERTNVVLIIGLKSTILS